MKPDGLVDNYYFGGGGDTLVTPLALCVFFFASVLMLVLPRKYAVVPFFLAGLLITVRQQIVVAGLHLMIYRLLILIGWVRIVWSSLLTKREPFLRRMTSLDKVFVAWACSNALMFTILWGESGALINRLGFLYTTLGTYFLLRYLIRDREDVILTIEILAKVSVIIAIFMVPEHISGRNAFSIFGGVAEFSDFRNGRIRAQGPFLHSIVAGTFGAMLLPLFMTLWREGKPHRVSAMLGVVSSTAIAIASASSTPMMTYAAGVLGVFLWPLRRRMRALRWGLVFVLIGIQAFMKAPIWFLINRISALTGGTGWHRSELVDQFLRHFGDWWVIGTTNNASWGLDMWDSINAYVNAGVEGGLITFILFVSLFVFAYKTVGKARKLTHDRKSELLIWGFGVAVFANTVAFFGITYFDQSVIGWYTLLAMTSICDTFSIAANDGKAKYGGVHAATAAFSYDHVTAFSNSRGNTSIGIEMADFRRGTFARQAELSYRPGIQLALSQFREPTTQED